MKRYGIFLAILALVLASLACQTLSGGGSSAPAPSVPGDDGGVESQPAEQDDDSLESQPAEQGDDSGAAPAPDSEFPIPDGALNLQNLGGSTNFQVKMTLDEAMKFYMDALSSQGYSERPILTVTSETTFSMVFDGHASGKAIVVQGVDFGDGTVNVNIRLEDT